MKKHIKDIAVILGLFFVTLWVCKDAFFYGVEMDEVLRLNPLFPLIGKTVPYPDQGLYYIDLFGVRIPLVFKLYVSSAIMLPYYPLTFFADPFVGLRVMSGFYLFLAGVTVYLVAKKYSRIWAFLLALSILMSPLLGAHLLVRQAQTYHIICYALSFYFIRKFLENNNQKNRNFIYVFFSSFFIFLAMNLEFYAAWSVVSLALVVPLLCWPQVKAYFAEGKAKLIFLLGAVGCINFIWYNLADGLPVLRTVYSYVFKIEEYNKEPIDGRNIVSLSEDFGSKWSSLRHYWGPSFRVFLLLFAIMAVITLICLFRDIKKKQKTHFLFYVPFFVTLFVCVFIFLSPKANRSGHFAHVHPFLNLCFFLLPVLVFNLKETKKWFFYFCSFLPIAFLGLNIVAVNASLKNALVRYSTGLWSSSFNTLNHYLEETPEVYNKMVVLNWGFSEQLFFLNKGQKLPVEFVFPVMMRASQSEMINDYQVFFESVGSGEFFKYRHMDAKKEELVFLKFIKGSAAAINRSNEALEVFLKEKDGQYEVLKEFADSDGTPLFHIIRLKNPEVFYNKVKGGANPSVVSK
ncbi:MAG TPA: hypothetical protein VIG33_04465 [Pseudobdellovibrionaceae bacterium]